MQRLQMQKKHDFLRFSSSNGPGVNSGRFSIHIPGFAIFGRFKTLLQAGR